MRVLFSSYRSVCTAALVVFSALAIAPNANSQVIATNADENYEFAINHSGQYVLAWTSWANRRPATRLLRGTVNGGPNRRWILANTPAEALGVAINESGAIAVGWNELSPGKNSDRATTRAELVAPDGAVTKRTLTRKLPHIYENRSISVAINEAGQAAFAWDEGIRTDTMRFARLSTDGTFSGTTKAFVDRRGGGLVEQNVSIDQQGGAAINWVYGGINCKKAWFPPKHCRNQSPADEGLSISSSGVVSEKQTIAHGCDRENFAAAPDGTRILALNCWSRGLVYASAGTNAPFGPLTPLGMSGDAYPEVSIFSNGLAYVAAEECELNKSNGWDCRIRMAAGTAGGAFVPPPSDLVTYTYPDENYSGASPHVIEGPNAAAYLVWDSLKGKAIAPISSAGTLGAVTSVPPSGHNSGGDHDVTLTPSGLGLSMWTSESSDGYNIHADQFLMPAP